MAAGGTDPMGCGRLVAAARSSRIKAAQVKAFRKLSARWGSLIVLTLGLLFIIGFHNMPALWVPVALVVFVGWLLGERADHRDKSGRKSE
jgi:hypothetical protein